MGIVDEDVARVRDTADLVALIGEQVALRRVGQRYVGLCPFHQEKTPSFSVNPVLNLWHCFGCQKSGDAISFIRETEHLDFPEAVERLAQRAGIQLRYDSRNQAKDKSRKARLSKAVGEAVEFYHQQLLESPEGGAARRYLRGRGFDGDAARRFQLGWSPEGWDHLSRWLQQERKFSRDDIVGAGLGFENKANRLQDQFRSRLMFPIHDARGEPVGFGGRAIADDGPKYKNSPETAIYQKSRLLYGVHWAKADIVASDRVVICEGYTDVMAFALAGVPNSVATCGTAITNEHVRILKNLTRNVVLAYDADSAGQGAAEQWYKWEVEFDLEVGVADLPAGQDPGDLWQTDQSRLSASINHAVPLLEFHVERVLGRCDLASPDGRARAAQLAAEVIAEYPGDLKRETYAMTLGSRLDVHVPTIRAAIEESRHAIRRGNQRSKSVSDDVERHALSRDAHGSANQQELLIIAIDSPELIPSWVGPELFAAGAASEIFSALLESSTTEGVLRALPPEFHTEFYRLSAAQPSFQLEESRVEADLELRGGSAPHMPEMRAALARSKHSSADPVVQRQRLVSDFAAGVLVDRASEAAIKWADRDDGRSGDVKKLAERLQSARDASDFDGVTDWAKRLVALLRDDQSVPVTDEAGSPAELVE